MKKIIIIDGGPRATFNTASMLKKFAEGASSVSNEIEVKTIRLSSQVCKYKDALTPVLEEIAQADGLALGSPNYFGEITGQMRAFLERLAFPWLSYNDYSITAPKRMPVVLVETQNGGVGGSNCNGYGTMEPCIAKALGQPEKLFANNTYQVKNYDNFELGGFSEEAKRKYREEHWEKDLQKAFDAGRRMAETIIKA